MTVKVIFLNNKINDLGHPASDRLQKISIINYCNINVTSKKIIYTAVFISLLKISTNKFESVLRFSHRKS